jgi:hypothetical protein
MFVRGIRRKESVVPIPDHHSDLFFSPTINPSAFRSESVNHVERGQGGFRRRPGGYTDWRKPIISKE